MTEVRSAPSTVRLAQIRDRIEDGRQIQRGDDGFEVPTYVLPMTPQEAREIINELIAWRSAHGTK